MTPKIQFNKTDRYFIDQVPYANVGCDEVQAYFRREDGTNAVERFAWTDLHNIVGGPRWNCEKRSSTVIDAKRQADPFANVWELPPKQLEVLLDRWCFVTALDKLHAEGKIILKPQEVKQNYAIIHLEASKAWSAVQGDFGKQYFGIKSKGLSRNASASSILRWRRLYHQSGQRIVALKDSRGRKSKLEIDQESFKFIMKHLRLYLLDQRHTKRETAEKTVAALQVENARRSDTGDRPLETRSRSTLCDWISKFTPLETEAGRFGIRSAKIKYAGVGMTERPTRPGEVFQVDEWEVDAKSLIMDSPMREGLDQETLRRLPKDRRWFYVVMDVATRYIVGFLIASSQNSDSAVRALEMATLNKDHLAKASGSKSSWAGFPFESIESDTGSAFIATATQRAVNGILATYKRAQVGEPQLRGHLERFFGSLTKRAMPYVPGRTFSNPAERGDYDSDGRAALTDDQLALIFIRYFVDVYHQTEHPGLFNETPAAALERLGGTVGLPPQISKTTRRHAFGIRQTRTIDARGIRFLAINYNSDELQQIRRSPSGNEVSFYVDRNDLGTISVWNNDKWLEVPCSVENFSGISLLKWLEVSKLLRNRYAGNAEIRTSIIFEALHAMQKVSNDAMTLMGVLPQVPTAQQLADLERNLYWGLSVIDDAVPDLEDFTVADNGIGYVINSEMGGKSTEIDRPALPLPPQLKNTGYAKSGLKKDRDNWWLEGDDQ